VGGERRTSFSFVLLQAVEFGVERVGEVVPQRGRTSDRNGCLRQWRTIEREEALPGGFAPEGAGLGQGKFRQMQPAQESGSLSGIRRCACGQAIVELRSDRSEYAAEFFNRQAAGFSFRNPPKFFDQSI